MSFNYPWMLFLLLIPAVIVAWIWRRSGRHVVLPLDHSGHKGGRWLGRLVNAASCFPVLALAVVIIVLSGPLRLSEPKTKRRLTNIEFCVDISGSMDESDLIDAEGETAPKMMSVGLHGRVAGHPGRAAALARFLDYVRSHAGVWIARRDQIARHWRAEHPYAG